MALVWVEPFDQYGSAGGLNPPLPLNAGYTVFNITGWPAGRTGLFSVNLNASLGGIIRRPLDNPGVSILGQGAGWAISSPGANSVNNYGFRFESAGPVMECTIVPLSNNGIGVYDRTSVLKGSSASNILIPGSFSWVEAKVTMNAGGVINTGIVEVRVNGNTVLTVNGINLPNTFAFHALGSLGGSNSTNMDDWIVWDNTGAVNNDFMGDRRLFVSYPNANLATQNFTPSVGNAFDRINDVPPVDTSYIDGAAAGNISEFSKDLIGINSTDIAAVVVLGRLFKTDAGVASGRLGINSNGFVANSAELFPGTTGSFFKNIVERDPNGNIQWTKAAVDAAALRITRVQ
jgi:hypothetical protein